MHPIWDWKNNPEMCPHQGSNLQTLFMGQGSNQLGHTGQGTIHFLNGIIYFKKLFTHLLFVFLSDQFLLSSFAECS